ncbi:isoleucyl-tRNA synthetase [Pedobacter sp.]
MVRKLKLKKAVIAIVLGVLALVAAKIMEAYRVTGHHFVLTVSGVLLILGSLILLYPILFAKKADKDGKHVELQPAAKEPVDRIEAEGVA